MKLPDESAQRITDALTGEALLTDQAAKELIEALNDEKQVNWDIVLTKQYQSEQEAPSDEA